MNPLVKDIRHSPLVWLLIVGVLVLMVYLIFVLTLFLLPPQAQ